MNIKSILMSSLLLLAGSISASAQEEKDFEYVFTPHWYVGVQGGAQYTLGEVGFSDLISPNAQVSVGYNFDKVVGTRLGINAWQSKGGLTGSYGLEEKAFERTWKYNYVAPNIDLTFNLSNLLCGVNPKRCINVGAFIGLGANIAFKNDEANDVSRELLVTYPEWVGVSGQNIEYLWDGTKVRLQGRAGMNVDFRVNDKVSLGVEVNANVLNDKYNSKKAGNADWYFNGLVGLKYNLGSTYGTRKIKKPEPVIIEKIIEKPVEKIVEKIVEKPVADNLTDRNYMAPDGPMRQDIFFTISSTSIVKAEQLKINEVVAYMKKHPRAKVSVTGYADKGTGKAPGNLKLSEKRAAIVVEALKKAGISADRIESDFKGDTVQPFEINDMNRVSICICK